MYLAHTTLSRGSYETLEDLLVEEDETAFDRAVLVVLFWGTEQQLRNRFPKGSATNYPGVTSAGGKMVCAGVKITRARFGFLWARVEWQGMVNPPSGITPGGGRLTLIGSSATLSIRGMTNNMSTTELMLPQMPPGGSTIVAGTPFNAASTYARARSRIIGEQWSSTYTGLLIVARTAPPAAPRLIGRSRPTGLDSTFNNANPSASVGSTSHSAYLLSQSNWFNGITATNSGGGGWCVRNFAAESTLVLGDYLLLKFTAAAEWIDRFTAG